VRKAGQELQDSIDHAKAAASALLAEGNQYARQRLEQIDLILQKTVGGLIGKTEEAALHLLQEATKEVKSLEEKIFDDLNKAIWNFECGGKRLLLQDLQAALGKLGRVTGTNEIIISMPPKELQIKRFRKTWYCLWWCSGTDTATVSIYDNFDRTYVLVRNVMEDAISAENIKDITPANNIPATYEYLSAFAKKTSCFYDGSSEVWNREYVKYQEQARQMA
jgi:hypothetical protein